MRTARASYTIIIRSLLLRARRSARYVHRTGLTQMHRGIAELVPRREAIREHLARMRTEQVVPDVVPSTDTNGIDWARDVAPVVFLPMTLRNLLKTEPASETLMPEGGIGAVQEPKAEEKANIAAGDAALSAEADAAHTPNAEDKPRVAADQPPVNATTDDASTAPVDVAQPAHEPETLPRARVEALWTQYAPVLEAWETAGVLGADELRRECLDILRDAHIGAADMSL